MEINFQAVFEASSFVVLWFRASGYHFLLNITVLCFAFLEVYSGTRLNQYHSLLHQCTSNQYCPNNGFVPKSWSLSMWWRSWSWRLTSCALGLRHRKLQAYMEEIRHEKMDIPYYTEARFSWALLMFWAASLLSRTISLFSWTFQVVQIRSAKLCNERIISCIQINGQDRGPSNLRLPPFLWTWYMFGGFAMLLRYALWFCHPYISGHF